MALTELHLKIYNVVLMALSAKKVPDPCSRACLHQCCNLLLKGLILGLAPYAVSSEFRVNGVNHRNMKS